MASDRCWDNATDAQFAVKVIPPGRRQYVEREVAMLDLVEGRPGFVQLHEVFEGQLNGKDSLFLLLECALYAAGNPV